MARVEFDDIAGPMGELALQPSRGAPVLGANEVCRWHLLPSCRTDPLPGHLHALPGKMIRRLRLDLEVAVLQEGVVQQLGPNSESTCVRVDLEEGRRPAIPEVRQALTNSGR